MTTEPSARPDIKRVVSVVSARLVTEDEAEGAAAGELPAEAAEDV